MINKKFGTALYYLAWPLIWFYGPLNIRVRVIIKCDHEVLLVKNWFGPNTFQLPGGGKKFNEKPLDTGIREVNEELGIDLKGRSRQINEEVSIQKTNGILFRYIYVKAEVSSKPEVKTNSEISEYSWVKENSNDIPKSVRPYL